MPNAAWTVAAPLSRLRKSKGPIGFRAHETDYVVFLNEEGKAKVLLDRCPHRGVQLSRGRPVQGRVACGYHGWQFDGEGSCVAIPSLREDQRIPEGICVASFSCVEQDGWAWFWPIEGETPTTRPLPFPEFHESRWIQSTLSMACDWRKPLENNTDPTHAAFAHPWTHPQWYARKRRGVTEASADVRITETGFVLFTPATEQAGDPIPAKPPISVRFDLPGRVTVCFHKPFRQVIALEVVPTDPGHCRMETQVTNPLPFGSKLRWSSWEHPVFRQDRLLMESAERSTSRWGHGFERSVEADYSMLLVRKMIELHDQGLWTEKRESLQARRVLRFRA